MTNISERRHIIEEIEKKEVSIQDPDLNSVEGWILGATHFINIHEEGVMSTTPEILSSLLITEKGRSLALTPQNVLEGKVSVVRESIIRTTEPYSGGYLSLFGSELMFSGLRHRVYLSPLTKTGEADQLSIEFLKDGNVIDPEGLSLKMDDYFGDILHEPEIRDGRINIKVK